MSATKRFLEELPDMIRQTEPTPPQTGGVCFESKTEPTRRWVYLDQIIEKVDEKIKSLDENDANSHIYWSELKTFLLDQRTDCVKHDDLYFALKNQPCRVIDQPDDDKIEGFIKRKYTSGYHKPKDVFEHWSNYKRKSK